MKYIEYAGNEKLQVQYNIETVLHAMNLRARTCTCHAWQLSGIASCYVIALVVSRDLNVMEL